MAFYLIYALRAINFPFSTDSAMYKLSTAFNKLPQNLATKNNKYLLSQSAIQCYLSITLVLSRISFSLLSSFLFFYYSILPHPQPPVSLVVIVLLFF